MIDENYMNIKVALDLYEQYTDAKTQCKYWDKVMKDRCARLQKLPSYSQVIPDDDKKEIEAIDVAELSQN